MNGRKVSRQEFSQALDDLLEPVRDDECDIHTFIGMMDTDEAHGAAICGDAERVMELLLKVTPRVVEQVQAVRPDLVEQFHREVERIITQHTGVDTQANLSEFTRRAKFVH